MCRPITTRAEQSIRLSTEKCKRGARWMQTNKHIAYSQPGKRSPAWTGSGPRDTNRGTWCATREVARRTASKPESTPASSAQDEKENLVTVKRENGDRVSYDPRRLHGVTLYRETERSLAQGDRVQFTAPNREQRIANRELGTLEKIDDSGNLQVRLDSGRTVAFNIKENPHIDYGYAVTSHSSQGQTADRVLVHIDTEQAGEKLVNRRLAYVAVSRGRYDAQVYTNDKGQLADQLSRDVSHRSAIEPSRESAHSAQKIEPPSAQSQVQEHVQQVGHSISR